MSSRNNCVHGRSSLSGQCHPIAYWSINDETEVAEIKTKPLWGHRTIGEVTFTWGTDTAWFTQVWPRFSSGLHRVRHVRACDSVYREQFLRLRLRLTIYSSHIRSSLADRIFARCIDERYRKPSTTRGSAESATLSLVRNVDFFGAHSCQHQLFWKTKCLTKLLRLSLQHDRNVHQKARSRFRIKARFDNWHHSEARYILSSASRHLLWKKCWHIFTDRSLLRQDEPCLEKNGEQILSTINAIEVTGTFTYDVLIMSREMVSLAPRSAAWAEPTWRRSQGTVV